MPGYIDKDETVKMLALDYAYAAADMVKEMPAADVAPVVHGKVTHITEDAPYCEYGICNVCGAYIQSWNYCPKCGAKMDGGGQSGN